MTSNFMNCLCCLSPCCDGKIEDDKPWTILNEKTQLQQMLSSYPENAKPISEKEHADLASIVSHFLESGENPNEFTHKETNGDIEFSGCPPPVILAAVRGYYKVVEVFKRHEKTNFALKNKSNQNILHLILKAGYFNKIEEHGDDSGNGNIKVIEVLFDEKINPNVTQMLKKRINKKDKEGNTALHFAALYKDQSVARLLLRNGAKLNKNNDGSLNVRAKTLDEYLRKDCIEHKHSESNADLGVYNKDFEITVKFDLFKKIPRPGQSTDFSYITDHYM